MKHRIRVAVMIFQNNKILLVKHVHPDTGFEWWVPPGGGMEERDESIFDCAKREVFEETNLKVEIDKIIYIREFFDKEHNTLNIELFTLASSYEGAINLENLKGNGADEFFIKNVAWLLQEELKDLVVFPEILKDTFWDDYKNGFPQTTYLGRQINK